MITLIVCTTKTGYVISKFPASEYNKALATFHMIDESDDVECAVLYNSDGEFVNGYAKGRH